MDNRENILACALDLFYAKGYDAVGTQEIVKAAGVTKPTMYYYFGSKAGLLEALLKEHFEELLTAVDAVTDAMQGMPFPDILFKVASVFMGYAVTHEKAYRFALALYYTGAENEGHKLVEPLVRAYYERLVKVFLDAADQLGNMNGRQREFALGLQGLLDTTFLMYCNQPEEERRVPDEDMIRNILRQFMYGIYS